MNKNTMTDLELRILNNVTARSERAEEILDKLESRVETLPARSAAETRHSVIFVNMPDGSVYPVKELLTKKNLKLFKSNKSDKMVRTVGLTLSPADSSGYEVCAMRSAGCTMCFRSAGNNAFPSVARAQVAKTRAFFQHKDAFLAKLAAEIDHERTKAHAEGLDLAVRLNMMSDLRWERIVPYLFEQFADVQFYDYTKIPNRVTPGNYHLTFSRSEVNEPAALAEFQRGRNVAVVFAKKELPATWHGVPVLNGDETDLRFLDKRGIIGLYAKGNARKDTTGFVVR